MVRLFLCYTELMTLNKKKAGARTRVNLKKKKQSSQQQVHQPVPVPLYQMDVRNNTKQAQPPLFSYKIFVSLHPLRMNVYVM